jgi:hypothetical protein
MQEAAKPKKSPEDLALEQFRKRTEKQIAEFERRLREGDFSTRQRKELPEFGREELRLKYELEKAKSEYAKAKVQDQIANLGLTGKIGYYGMEAANLSRAIKTSFDFSAILRQGAFIFLGHPIEGIKAVPDMFRAAWSAQAEFKANQQILMRNNYRYYARDGLYLSEHGKKLSQMEEAYMSRWIDNIPTWLGGGLVRGSQRAYTIYLNRIRADSYDRMVDSWGENGRVTPEQGQTIANFINVATGRGAVGKKETALGNALVGLNTVFFAPRFVLSRFQTLLGQPIIKAKGWEAKARIASEYGRTLAGLGVVYTLAMAAGADIEIDPRSSSFGKIKFGNTTIDPLAGLSQATVLLSRVISGETKTMSGQIKPLRGDNVPYGSSNTADVIANFLRSKLSPVASETINLVTGKDVTGRKTTFYDIPQDMLTPLAMSDILSAMEDQGVPAGAGLGVISIFGMNLNTIDPTQRR